MSSSPSTADPATRRPRLLAAHGPTHFISADSDLTFGQAIAAAVRVMAPPESDSEMLWLLAQDSAPEPGALEALLGELEIALSVAVAGPKIMDWRAHDYIHDVGLSMTPGGATVTLVESELDQGQHDGMSDVLAVDAGGMLVRHSVWNQLGGFDPGLPSADDALDFCVRVRLSGRRVSVVAAARVASAGDGVAGLSGSSRGRARRKRLRVARAAQLHRRLVYSAGWLIPLHWIALVPFAFFRSVGALLQKEPGAIPGEFSAAFRTAFSGSRVSNARRRLAETRTLGWGSIASLRLTNAEVRRRNILKREAVLVGLGADRPEPALLRERRRLDRPRGSAPRNHHVRLPARRSEHRRRGTAAAVEHPGRTLGERRLRLARPRPRLRRRRGSLRRGARRARLAHVLGPVVLARAALLPRPAARRARRVARGDPADRPRIPPLHRRSAVGARPDLPRSVLGRSPGRDPCAPAAALALLRRLFRRPVVVRLSDRVPALRRGGVLRPLPHARAARRVAALLGRERTRHLPLPSASRCPPSPSRSR
ncbi:hypothetical protein KIV56_14345 [Cryobacterium breve]|uniref:Glycosyltransferase family 2 protein n=1 Tax=Cryobacterium breve TaxID=1259258 RepID=A0ABY7NAG9_9MICO|nr:glycosyltransferase [Cryobacterium breve]WBM79501.1 hypothetical protein KIV56_14345 [Cryobacterium breve]